MATWRFTASGELYGSEKWANVFHLDIPGEPNYTAINAAFVKFYVGGAASHNVLFHCAGDVGGGTIGVHLSQFAYQKVVDPLIPVVYSLDNDGGQNTPGGLPVDVSLVISWRTTHAGPSFRGRTYLPPFHEQFNNDGPGDFPGPTTACQNNIAAAAGTLLTDLQAADSPLVIYSRKTHVSTDVLNGYVDDEWDTQRRRSFDQPKVRVLFGPTSRSSTGAPVGGPLVVLPTGELDVGRG